MILDKTIAFLLLFSTGEIFFNLTLMNYLKKYFSSDEPQGTTIRDKKIFYLPMATFKGILERFIISICLLNNILPILTVFGALKIGTRLSSKDNIIANDYFLIGNLCSILISVTYYLIFSLIYPPHS